MRFTSSRPAQLLSRFLDRVAFSWPVLVLLLGSVSVAATAGEFVITAAPDWVSPVSSPRNFEVPVGQISDGVYYLLSDTQIRIEGSGKSVYRHLAMKAVTESGVQTTANVEIGFDPSYQRLSLHAINVIRDGRTIAKLASASIRILQREKELEYLIFDGSKTANVFLDDVRVGDVVEYSYSLSGANPVFGNFQFGTIPLQWAVPVERLHARLLVPVGRPIGLHARNTPIRPTAVQRGGFQTYEINQSRLRALIVEKDAPAWFDPYPAVEWSEFEGWQAVAQWAAPLYQVPTRLSPAIQAEVSRIARSGRTDTDKLLSVLRFVQREIRYLGVEIGPGSHAPRQPGLVFDRRFGDCKDKALLTTSMLGALGIRARPALVNTALRQGVGELTPSPGAFNHVIVQARIGNRDYWIDPTRITQKGTLDKLFQPNFGFALIVDRTTKGLERMKPAASSAFKKTVRATFDSSAGLDQPVRYTVTTTAEGRGAEELRNTFANSNLQNLQKTYLNYYAGYYPAISVASPMTMSEDDSNNRITVVEHYAISDFWPRSSTAARREASIEAPDVEDYLRASPSSIRLAPIAVGHPVDFTQTTEVLLPETWDIEADTTTIDDPAFAFERVTTPGEKRIVIKDHYQSRVDHVAAKDAARYADSLKRARASLGYELYFNDTPPAPAGHPLDRFNWTLALLGCLLLLLFSWAARKLHRYDPPRSSHPIDPGLQGLGGWLILPAIGVVLMPFHAMSGLYQLLPALGSENWSRLTSFGSADYHALWAPLLLFELGVTLAQLVAGVLLIILLFKRRSSTPRVYIAVLAASFLAMVVDVFAATQVPGAEAAVSGEDITSITRTLFALLLWGTYFLVSKRVRSTFIRRWRPDSAPPPIPEAAAGPAAPMLGAPSLP